MLRISALLASLALLAALLAAPVSSDIILSDNAGQSGLKLPSGNPNNFLENGNIVGTTNNIYAVTVYVDEGNTNEGFCLQHLDNGAFDLNSMNMYVPSNYGQSVLESIYFSSQGQNASGIVFDGIVACPDLNVTQFEANPPAAQVITTQGAYTFYFLIPPGKAPNGNINPLNSVLGPNVNAAAIGLFVYAYIPQPYNVSTAIIEFVFFNIQNQATVVGDPQFIGLRGQSYQVHGIDGAVYNLISSPFTQVNSRFIFLSEGTCPVVNGKTVSSNCWSHPGSYIGEMSFQEKVDGKIHSALVQAGSATKGFAMIQVDGKVLAVGERKEFGSFSIERTSTHHVSITTEEFTFDLDNSDHFINQAVAARVPLSQLKSHGLLGQTHAAKVYPSALKYIAGEVDDYVIADDNLFGTDFVHNQF